MNKLLYINEISEIFNRVQEEELYADQKCMADAIPRFEVSFINSEYKKGCSNKNFNLQKFIDEHFLINCADQITTQAFVTRPLHEHISMFWDKLTRYSPDNEGTLIGLPNPYIVPGGRFTEFFYWDSYFIMLGLYEAKRYDLIEGIVENCAFLIRIFGFVPNGNRTYFLSRSQPPFFSLMVQMLAEIKGELVFKTYLEELETEYKYWMAGLEDLSDSSIGLSKKCVKMPDGEVLNRYSDHLNIPRPESYKIDKLENDKSQNLEFYRDVRSACESGWDFSARWTSQEHKLSTIETQKIVPVDLNCLLWNLEITLEKAYRVCGEIAEEEKYCNKASQRKIAINKYFWNNEEGFYFDFHHGKQRTKIFYHLAAIFPLFFGLASEYQAESVLEHVEKKFLSSGGLINTLHHTGQQWDAPNGWAPYQWLTHESAVKYNKISLAKNISERWCNTVERVYKNTGKVMEKYNVVDANLIGGGGEYPNQDGFGWTNAVYLKFKNSKSL